MVLSCGFVFVFLRESIWNPFSVKNVDEFLSFLVIFNSQYRASKRLLSQPSRHLTSFKTSKQG